MDDRRWARRMATWIARLARPDDMATAGSALLEIEMSYPKVAETKERGVREAELALVYSAAVAELADQLPQLVPALIARYLELVAIGNRQQAAIAAAAHAGTETPEIDLGRIITTVQIIKVLRAIGERMDPYLGPLVAALGTQGRDGDEELLNVLECAGPRITEAIPAMFKVLRHRGIWCWPSHVGQGLARAAQFDGGVLTELRQLLKDDDERIRRAAIEVLGYLGQQGEPARDELLAFRNGSEHERCAMIHALAEQRAPAPAVLELLAAAMRDDNGYVRRAAVYALSKLRPEPARFVPLLMDACDYQEPLHDESLQESAVAALGEYGPAAGAALPRLRLFVEGPIKGRTVGVKRVKKAIDHIVGEQVQLPDTTVAPPKAETPLSDDDFLFGVVYQGRQCYIDGQGRIVLDTRFRHGTSFSGGRAIVDDEKSRFVIDRAGNIVFECRWNEMKPFSEGLAAVRCGPKWGFVDKAGRVVIEPQFDSVTPFSEGLAGVELGRVEDTSGEMLTCDYPGKKGFIDRMGTIVIPVQWHEADTFHGGRAAVCTGGVLEANPLFSGREMLTDRKYGYIDTSGRLVIDGIYSIAGQFREGLAAVNRGNFFGRSRAGFIDINGNEIIPGKFVNTQEFKNGVALVKRRGKKWRAKQTVIDRQGRVILEQEHALMEMFSEGLAAVWTGTEWGFIDLHGRIVIEPQFDQCEPFTHGLAEVQRGDWYGLIDRSGKFVWGPTTEGRVCRVLDSEWA